MNSLSKPWMHFILSKRKSEKSWQDNTVLQKETSRYYCVVLASFNLWYLLLTMIGECRPIKPTKTTVAESFERWNGHRYSWIPSRTENKFNKSVLIITYLIFLILMHLSMWHQALRQLHRPTNCWERSSMVQGSSQYRKFLINARKASGRRLRVFKKRAVIKYTVISACYTGSRVLVCVFLKRTVYCNCL